MVDDLKDITEKAESKEALDRARLLRERREAEQRRRLDDLRAHAAAAQAQREKREGERRKRQAEQRARDDDRRQQVEERKRAIWEASISRREALLQRERDRSERMERARAARSAPRPAFAFGSSTPRLLEPVDSAGFFWAARRAASTTNVMYASAPLTRRASALQLDSSDTDNKDEADRSPQAVMWSSVARRRTDLVPTVPAPRAPGRAYSMTRLDKLPSNRPLHSASPSMHHLNRNQTRSGETTPGSRPGSAMSNATAGVVRRANSAPRKPRPASIAGTGCNTPRGDTGGLSVTSTPAVSRDGSTIARPATTPRRPRPLSLHVSPKPATQLGPGEGKPPMHRKPKPAKDQDKGRRKSLSASPGRTLSPSPAHTKETSVDKEMSKSMTSERQVDAQQVTQKLEALQVQDTPVHTIENKENIEANLETNIEDNVDVNGSEVKIEVQKPEETQEVPKVEQKKEASVEKTEDNEMTASMLSRRITTEEEAKAALAERRRRAREELERQAELERLRLQREAEEEAERQRQEEERQRREEEEARELAALQRKMDEEKLKKAIEAQQQLERDEAERKAREELDKLARIKEDEEKRRAAEEAEKIRKEELEREEKERHARKQRVEAIMARTRLKKQAEEDKKKEQEKALSQNAATENPTSAQQENKMEVSPYNNSKSGQGLPTVTESNVTGNFESVNVTPDVTESPNATSNATQSVNVTDSDVITAKESGNVAETIKVGVPNVSGLVKVAEPKISELVNVSESERLIELAEDVVIDVTDNGNVQTADLLSLATSQPEGKSTESWQPHVNNGNVEALAANARTDNKLSQESGEPSSMKMDNANVDTNNGNVPNVGHISANFLHSERMSEHNQKELDEFTTHNGHGITHPLTLQNAI